MEFFFPADVFTAYPRQQGPSARTTSYGAGPSTNIFSGCGFDSHPFFADSLADAIQHERAAAQARAQAQAQRAARAEAARRAKAAAARRAAEEQRQQAQAYLQHIFEVQQREAQRRFHLEQLHRQRQEEHRRQQYEEYQRRKAYAIEKERQRIAAAKAAAQDQSKQLFLALEDLIFGGLNGFFHAHQQNEDEDEDERVELAHKNDTQQHTAPQPLTQTVDVKGKGKAKAKEEDDTEHAMDVDNNDDAEDTAAAAAAALMVTDEDPEEVGPVPTSPVTESAPAPVSTPAPVAPKTTEQLLFTHAFPSSSNFDKSTVRADAINVSVDEAQRKVTVSGLWNNEPTAPAAPARSASPTPSDSSSRRGRSRSPKRARVSDVDENGDEIVTPDADTNDDFVEVSFTRASPAEHQKTVEKTFDLPHGANIEDLRAELTDEGLKLFTTVTA